MANEICIGTPAGSGVFYAVLRTLVTQVYNGTGFETPIAANWTAYAITLTNLTGVPYYTATFPALPAGDYEVDIYQRLGSTPAPTDPIKFGPALMKWDGSAEIPAYRLASALQPNGAGGYQFTGTALALAPTGGGSSSGYKPGDAFEVITTEYDVAGMVTPTSSQAAMFHNGTVDGSVTMTVTAVTVLSGPALKITGTIPSGYAPGDKVQVFLQIVASGVTFNSSIANFILGSATGSTDPWGGVITTSEAGEMMQHVAAAVYGNRQENSSGSSCVFLDVVDGTTPRVTSTITARPTSGTATTRTVTTS